MRKYIGKLSIKLDINFIKSSYIWTTIWW